MAPGALALALAAGLQGAPVILDNAQEDPRGLDMQPMLGPV